MREYLIRLYCAIGEIQKQKEDSEANELKKQIENMRKNMLALKEENIKLRKELETIKERISPPGVTGVQQHPPPNRRANEEGRNNKDGTKGTSSIKRLSQPSLTPMERKNKNTKIRRELSYPMDAHSSNKAEEKGREGGTSVDSQIKRKKKENLGKQNKERKRSVRLDSLGDSGSKKKKSSEKTPGKKGEQQQLWSKVIGRKERRRSIREENTAQREKIRSIERNKIRKPLKTSAVVITVGDRNVSYSEVLSWVRQSVRLNEEELNAITLKGRRLKIYSLR